MQIHLLYRTRLKSTDIDRTRLITLKDSYEKKEIELNKLSSELRVQVIELRETNVCI